MTTLTPYDACRIFLALKTHFTTDSYDYTKYHGKLNLTNESFMVRKDRFSFVKLSRKYKVEEYENFCIANILKNPKIYSKDLTGSEAEEIFRKKQKTIESLAYVFRQDLDNIFTWYETKKENCPDIDLDYMLKLGKDGRDPPLLRLYYTNDITIETLILLDKILDFVKVWNAKITDDIIWPNTRIIIEKYKPFLPSDVAKYKKILKEKMKE